MTIDPANRGDVGVTVSPNVQWQGSSVLHIVQIGFDASKSMHWDA